MGHRSSKLTAGPTDGKNRNINSTCNKDKKSKTSCHPSTRFPKSLSTKNDRNNSRENKNYRNFIERSKLGNTTNRISSSNSISRNDNDSITEAAVTTPFYEDNTFFPILQLESEPCTESLSPSHNSTSQIIIKIRFKTNSQSVMMDDDDNNSNGSKEHHVRLPAVATTPRPFSAGADDEPYRGLMDTNSNRMMSQQTTALNVTQRAAGSSSVYTTFDARNNNDANHYNDNVVCGRALLSRHLNALQITEDDELSSPAPTLAEYYEANEEEATISNSNHNHRIEPSGTRRHKAKSAFMNFRSKFGGVSGVTCGRNTNDKCNTNYSLPTLSTALNPLLTAAEMSKEAGSGETPTLTPIPSTCASNIYHDTVLRNTLNFMPSPMSINTTTSAAAAPITTQTHIQHQEQVPITTLAVSAAMPETTETRNNPHLSIWTTNKDVIISSINLVVCPLPATDATLERIMATELDTATVAAAATTTGSSAVTGLNIITKSEECDSANVVPSKLSKTGPIVHSQVDFVHYLVPDLQRIFNSSFYWGKMDRYEAERLLENKPEGTFLLRDSAQEEYLFSVTFRKYGRSLHARIEQNGNQFSFDCHDPAVFSTSTVTGLLEHYKDPGSVMFFEPMLTVPFNRKTVFSLQQLARAAIVSYTTYDSISELELPVRLKAYLKEYHYKQKLRVKLLDETLLTCT